MESLFNRYRNITALLVALFAQLILLAWQVRSDNDVPLVRVWAITAVTPVASAIENLRSGTTGFFGSYFALRDARQQSRKLRSEVDRLVLENQLLKNELGSAQRAEMLAGFQAHMPSKMLGARVIGTTTGTGTKSLLLDRGSQAGVRKGMAVVVPAGIVGKILAVYPFASQVLSVNDPGFAAGVESQKNHVHGVLKGVGSGTAKVDYIPTGQKVEVGEMFFTSGEDRIFPKGLPVGKVTGVGEGTNFQDIIVQPSGAEAAPEEVLIIVDPVHQEIPDVAQVEAPVFLAPALKAEVPPPAPTAPGAGTQPGAGGKPGATPGAAISLATPPVTAPGVSSGTQADKLREQYRKFGESQNYKYGEGGPGSVPINFNKTTAGGTPAGSAAANKTGTTASTPTGAPGASPKPAAAATKPAQSAPRPAPSDAKPQDPVKPPATPEPAKPVQP